TEWEDGRIKMYVTSRGLKFRKQHAALFLKGDFIPVAVEGPQRDCLIAFARRYRGDWAVVVVPRLTTRLTESDCGILRVSPLAENRLVLPKEAPRYWTNIFDDRRINAEEGAENSLLAAESLRDFPVALLSNAVEKHEV